jgi:hypothetical protein
MTLTWDWRAIGRGMLGAMEAAADQDIEDILWLGRFFMLVNACVMGCNVLVWSTWVISRYATLGFGAHPPSIFETKPMWKVTMYFAGLSRATLRQSTRGLTWEAVCKNGVGLGLRQVLVAVVSFAFGCLHIFCSLVCMATMPFVFILAATTLLMVANLFLLLTGVHALLLEQGPRHGAGLLGGSLGNAADGGDPDGGAGPAAPSPDPPAAAPSPDPVRIAAQPKEARTRTQPPLGRVQEAYRRL